MPSCELSLTSIRPLGDTGLADGCMGTLHPGASQAKKLHVTAQSNRLGYSLLIHVMRTCLPTC